MKATAANYVGILDKCLRQLGIMDFLEHIDFDLTKINDPQAYLDLKEFNAIVKIAYEMSACPYLGIVFGTHLSLSNHGFLGYAALTSPTLKMALQTMLNFLETRIGVLSAIFKVSGKDAYIELTPLTHDALIDRFVIELIVVHLSKLSTFLLNAASPHIRIEVALPAPSYQQECLPFFNVPIVFDRDKTRVWFALEDLDSPMSFADDTSYKQATMQLQALVEKIDQEFPNQIKNILVQENNFQFSVEDVAARLCCSPRTLRRRLQQYGVSYQVLLDEVRQLKAETLLKNNQLSITEISALLGFQDTSSFTKAFKRWTHYTPRDYRVRFKF